ncbi:MAG: NUDIX hydrolase [Thaumarchaeota archaeon]|nr:NUDIX hydrolase [Nitrososphaerota archaeon]MCL5318578.1 NUDIX hydrolase [Nitrososphaerota archaeon]
MYLEHLVHFPTITTDIVVIDSRSRFLLVKRNGNNTGWINCWATPGGRVLRNEMLTKAAHRILKRETGLNVAPRDFAFKGLQEIITPAQHAVTVVFKAQTVNSEVKLDDTSSDAKWFDSGEAPEHLKPFYRSILSMCDLQLRTD